MRGATILAIVMGVMLVVGTMVLIAVIISRAVHPPARSAARPYGAAVIEIPHGARVEGMTTGEGRLVLDLALPQGDRELVVIDLATGASVGTIKLRAAR